ncbi:hypothetical protein [Sporosarcina sp. FSL K6-1508]|uniref:hypothetical protein n=1 Tax=Sporosarcina sp. FSL K6-1508 TaxID=2921553 RepID=UPI0030FC04FD
MANIGIHFNDDGQLTPEDRDRNEDIINMVWNILSNQAGDSNREKYDAVSKLMRGWTSIHTTNGDYRGVPYFTPKAYEKYQQLWEENNHKLTQFSAVLGKHFTHEHILPVAAAVRLFNANNQITEELVREVLYNQVNAAVVTTDEAKLLDKSQFKEKMPESFYETGNIFERYRAVNLSLLYVVWSEGNKEIVGEPKPVNLQKDVLDNHIEHAMQDFIETARTNILEFLDKGTAELESRIKAKKGKKDE